MCGVCVCEKEYHITYCVDLRVRVCADVCVRESVWYVCKREREFV